VYKKNIQIVVSFFKVMGPFVPLCWKYIIYIKKLSQDLLTREGVAHQLHLIKQVNLPLHAEEGLFGPGKSCRERNEMNERSFMMETSEAG
jgi:hypothetical protein